MEEAGERCILQVSNAGICGRIRNFGVKPDFNLIVEDKIIFQGHKPIFGACSNFLLELFLKTPSSAPVMYILEDVESQDVENLLSFVYEGQISVTSAQSKGLLNAAKQLKIDSLIHQIAKYGHQMKKESNRNVAAIADNNEAFSGMPNLNLKEPFAHQKVIDPHFAPQLDVVEDVTPESAPRDVVEVVENENVDNHHAEISKGPSSSSSGTMFTFKAPHQLTVRKNAVAVSSSSELSSEQKQSEPNNVTVVKKCTPLLAIPNTVTIRRGRCKQPRIPTPFPSFKKPQQLQLPELQLPESLGEKELPPPPPRQPLSEKKFPKSDEEQLPVNKIPKRNKYYAIGLPLLSSTKLVPTENPAKESEKVKLDQNNDFIVETVDEGEEDKESGKNKEEVDEDKENEKPKSFVEAVVKVPSVPRPSGKRFCLAELVDGGGDKGTSSSSDGTSETSGSTITMSSSSSLSQGDQESNTTVFPKNGKLIRKKFQRKGSLPPPSPAAAEVGPSGRKRVSKSFTDHDFSSDDSEYLEDLRKKLPVAKRRRIPASNRPLIASSTFSPYGRLPRPKRPKIKSKA